VKANITQQRAIEESHLNVRVLWNMTVALQKNQPQYMAFYITIRSATQKNLSLLKSLSNLLSNAPVAMMNLKWIFQRLKTKEASTNVLKYSIFSLNISDVNYRDKNSLLNLFVSNLDIMLAQGLHSVLSNKIKLFEISGYFIKFLALSFIILEALSGQVATKLIK